jgi:hypothetical protein
MAKITPSRALSRLRKAFEDVFRYLTRRKVKGMPKRASVKQCQMIISQRDKGDKRAFFHVCHRGMWTLCTVPESGRLPDTYLYALVLHEFGHPLAYRYYGKSRQEDADRAIWEATGIPVLYRSDLVLQWVPPAVVRNIKQFIKR